MSDKLLRHGRLCCERGGSQSISRRIQKADGTTGETKHKHGDHPNKHGLITSILYVSERHVTGNRNRVRSLGCVICVCVCVLCHNCRIEHFSHVFALCSDGQSSVPAPDAYPKVGRNTHSAAELADACAGGKTDF